MRPAAAPHPLLRAALGAALACGWLTAGPAQAAPAAGGGRTKVAPAPAATPGQLHRDRGPARLALAARLRERGDHRGALAAARDAAAAFDAQLELHKALSEALPTPADARAERAAALALGLRRDEAFALVAELAERLGDYDLAVRTNVMLVQSQADQDRGRAAYAALRRLGWAASPAPTAPPPAPTPLPTSRP